MPRCLWKQLALTPMVNENDAELVFVCLRWECKGLLGGNILLLKFRPIQLWFMHYTWKEALHCFSRAPLQNWKPYLHFHSQTLSPSAGRRWNPNPTTPWSDWASSHAASQNHALGVNPFTHTNWWVFNVFHSFSAHFTHVRLISRHSQVFGADRPSVWPRWTSLRHVHAGHLSENTPASCPDSPSHAPRHTARRKSAKQVVNAAIRRGNHTGACQLCTKCWVLECATKGCGTMINLYHLE